MRRRVVLVPLLLLAGGSAALSVAPGAGGAVEPTIVEFTYTGAPESFEVPDGVTEIDATVCGAQGADGVSSATLIEGPVGPGGLGACVTTSLPVTPGETLVVTVGGTGTASAVTTEDTANAGSVGGFNGGARGSAVSATTSDEDLNSCFATSTSAAAAGGGGGGATDIRQGGTDLTDRVLVAGGGGGGGAGVFANDLDATFCPVPSPRPGAASTPEGGSVPTVTFARGGRGGNGGEVGGAGTAGDAATALEGPPGLGGTASAGGLGGVGDGVGLPGTAGDGGIGVADAVAGTEIDPCQNDSMESFASLSSGGGGGGGWFGGGGASYDIAPNDRGAGGGGGGGGGSSFGPPGSTFEDGVNAGPGSVLLTFTGPEVLDDDDEVAPEVISGSPTFAC